MNSKIRLLTLAAGIGERAPPGHPFTGRKDRQREQPYERPGRNLGQSPKNKDYFCHFSIHRNQFTNKKSSATPNPQKLARLVSKPHEPGHGAAGPLANLAIPGNRGLEKLTQVPQALLRVLVGAAALFGFGNAVAQHGHGGIYFALLALIQDYAEHLPGVLHRLEMVALIPHHVDEFDDPPALEFLEAGANVR